MTDTSGGISKLELAKEAVLRSIELLKPTDKVGVVIFDSSARWVTPITEVSNKDAILASVASIRSGGGTNILAGLQAAAQRLPADDGQVKHVILLTDGGSSPSGIPELVQRMNQTYKITLTSVAVGKDAAPFLSDLALLGGGRFHQVTDPQTIPNIFTEETTLATRSYVVEQPFSPQIKTDSPILSGIDSLPVLHGYVTSSPKEAGTMILTSELGDPILASWQYGLGKAVAFTSDASGRWARNWLTWGGFASFWNQVISYASSPVDSSNIELDVGSGNGSNTISVNARDEAGETLNSFAMTANIVSQDGRTQKVGLEQIGPGKYQAKIDALAPGSYTISVSGTRPGSDESIFEMFGWSQSYSPEYIPLLNQTTQTAQISPLVSMIDNPKQIFAHNLAISNSIQPVWQRLLIFAAILLVLDITVRRIKISNQDVAKRWKWLKGTLHLERSAPQTGPRPASQFSTLLDLKQQKQKNEVLIKPLDSTQSLILQSESIVSKESLPKTSKGEKPASTAKYLLSKKRERERQSN